MTDNADTEREITLTIRLPEWVVKRVVKDASTAGVDQTIAILIEEALLKALNLRSQP